ncbi:MAG: FAD-dependent oxidoreductase, partial [Woeseia sp.]
KDAVNRLSTGNAEETVGVYLARNNYSTEFIDHYLVPMAAAIWSAEQASVLGMPMLFLARFFHNHGLLQIKDRPQWRVIRGGSSAYVERLISGHADRIRLNCAVRGITRRADGVYVRSEAAAVERFDAVFMACHSDQALALLDDANEAEQEVLGSIVYQKNQAVLHTDARLMPRRKACWAAWNYHLPTSPGGPATVTYNMNILQGLQVPEQYLVSLNSEQNIDEERVLRRIDYEHPVFSMESHAAQARHAELNANGRTLFCGAYWRNGFHEDGVASAIAAVQHFEEARVDGQRNLRRAG